MTKKSLSDELEKLIIQHDALIIKIGAVEDKIAFRSSIQSYMAFFGLVLFFSSFVLFGGIILSVIMGLLDSYSNIFLIFVFILIVVWVVFFVVSRSNVRNMSVNSILLTELSEQSKEIESKINEMKLLIDKEKQRVREMEIDEMVPKTQTQSLELSKPKNPENGNYKFVSRSGEVKWGSQKEVAEWKKDEDELVFEEEQKKKGLVKFVPVRLQIQELMMEEGHDEEFDSKVSKKWKPRDVPSEITWATPEQVFEWTQKEKGYIKFIDNNGKIRWGTKDQIAEWQKEKNEKTRE